MKQSNTSSGRPIEVWRDRLVASDTLVFSRTVSEVNLVALDDLTSASDLSRVVGQDVSMATRLLRIASSALFNRQGRTVDTINAAIVRIGFDAIRDLAVSLTVIEQVLDGQPHVRVTQTMSRAFHAASQARSIAALGGDDRLEEVFAAALLRELGAMLFWADGSKTGAEQSATLERLLATGAPDLDAEQQALGFSLLELSSLLAEEWHLGSLLKTSLSLNLTINLDMAELESTKLSADEKLRVCSVLLGHQVAGIAEQHGLDSVAMRELIGEIAADLALDKDQLKDQVHQSYEDAGDIASRYGAARTASKLKPQAGTQRGSPSNASLNSQPAAQVLPQAAPPPNPQSQIEILQEIGDAVAQGLNLDHLVALILKGIHQGLGFDRAYFALLSPDRQQLMCRYCQGNTPPGFLGASRRLYPTDDPLTDALSGGQPLVLTPHELALAANNLDWLSYSSCALMPMVVQGKPIGLLYADRAVSQAEIDQTALRGFTLFGQQLATILLNIRNANSGITSNARQSF